MGQMIKLKKGDKLPSDAYCILVFREFKYDIGYRDGELSSLDYSDFLYTLNKEDWVDNITYRKLSSTPDDCHFIAFQVGKVPTIGLKISID
jgi:hypothetical protein